MTEREYNSAEGVRSSALWRMRESPEKFKYFLDKLPPSSTTLVFGTLVHKLLLERETFDEEFVILPEINRRTKDGRDEYEAFLREAKDRTVVTGEEVIKAAEMVKAIHDSPVAMELLNGDHEKPIFWVDELTGEKCKAKLDVFTERDGKPCIVDYKTAANASTDAFVRALYRYGYHFRAAMYAEGVKVSEGLDEWPDFIFLVQEKKKPYALNAVLLPGDVLSLGYDIFRELIGLYHECKETGYWYGYMGPFNEPNEAYLLEWVKHEADIEE